MAGRVEGKVAFITGAARGQGRSHAVRLAEEGADIIAVDACEDMPGMPYAGATQEDLAETVSEVEALGQRIVARKADVRRFDELQGAVDAGVDEFGRLDIVSANAGIGTQAFLAHEMPEDVWQDMIDINLTGVWHTCKAAVPSMIDGGRGGCVVLTASVVAMKGFANIANYVAAKHGLIGLMRSMANELGPHGIRVNSVLPTQVDTPMIMHETAWKLFRPDLESPTREDFAVASQGTGILPSPWVESIDVSNALLFLASDEGRFVTGVALPIDNGCLVK